MSVIKISNVFFIKILLQGRLTNRIKVEESMWTVDKDSKDIHINLEKTKETMWKSVFEVYIMDGPET